MALLIFDIDGVLVDSSQQTVEVIKNLLAPFPQLKEITQQQINHTFGMSEEDMWAFLMPGFPFEKRKEISRSYDEEIVKALKECDVLLPHVKSILAAFRKAGYILTTASNCGIPYLNAILDTQGIRKYFEDPQCLESVKGKKKADIIAYHSKKYPKEKLYMIGDRKTDIEAAEELKIPAIGCKSQFTRDGELEGACYKINNISEILDLITILQ
ncbi:MAG: HAD family hydrolase [Anaerocolumna sp.]